MRSRVDELMLRVSAILRRSGRVGPSDLLVLADLTLDQSGLAIVGSDSLARNDAPAPRSSSSPSPPIIATIHTVTEAN